LIGKHFSEILDPLEVARVSRRAVLPAFKGKVTGSADAPKLFDERRRARRHTRCLPVRIRSVDNQTTVQCEVMASGHYTQNDFRGTVGTIRSMDEEEGARDQLSEPASVGVIRNIETRAATPAMQERTRKLTVLGQLAGSIAHDLNNILSGVVTIPEMLLLQLDAESPIRELIEIIHTSGLQAATIVEDLLLLGRNSSRDKNICDCNQIVRDYFDSPQWFSLKSSREDITMRTGLCSDAAPLITGSGVHLQKVIMNLVQNAVEACECSGEVCVDVCCVQLDRPPRAEGHPLHGPCVQVSVSDNGTGMTELQCSRIFEPLYTTKVLGRSGTGLGLCIVRETVFDHGGALRVQSHKGQGTTFTLWFPRVQNDQQYTCTDSGQREILHGNSETVAVVQVSEPQQVVMHTVLQQLGYSVIFGKEVQAHFPLPKEVAVAVIELPPPEICSTPELVETMRSNNPDLPLFLVSAQGINDQLRQCAARYNCSVIAKPFSLADFSTALHQCLHHR
jgi:signal transduction histidine kinase